MGAPSRQSEAVTMAEEAPAFTASTAASTPSSLPQRICEIRRTARFIKIAGARYY